MRQFASGNRLVGAVVTVADSVDAAMSCWRTAAMGYIIDNMPLNIENYALISDSRSGALVGTDGSIDWLCLPRYDSHSLFGALLGQPEHGRWLIAPADGTPERAYAGDTFILRTTWTTPTGKAEVLDFMPRDDGRSDVIRIVRGIEGSVTMHEDLRIRFSYASTLPWVRQLPDDTATANTGAAEANSTASDDHGDDYGTLVAIGGPDALVRRGPRMRAADRRHTAEFTVEAGDAVEVKLAWFPSHQSVPAPVNGSEVMETSAQVWKDWAARCQHEGVFHREIVRSMLVLRALTNEVTGGIVAAATTSLPENFGGERNWDFRYVWLRDASLTLEVLLWHGYETEAQAWRRWLLRAVAGDPDEVQIMYGLAGERDLTERELDSLPGYRGARPVRVGNGAVGQFQADVLGEVMVALHSARRNGVTESEFSWPLQRSLMRFLESNWQCKDQGIWEMRGPARDFTHSRVMVWAAFDRAVRAIEEFGLDGPLERWRNLRDTVRDEVETNGFDSSCNSYVQHYDTQAVDASLLVLPQVGFCAPDDPRMLGTVAAIEEELLRDGLVLRYRTEAADDGLDPGEHPFIACSFWLVEQYAHSNRLDDAHTLMERLVGLVNDVGLLSEQYDVDQNRHAGNTPKRIRI